MRMGCVLLHPEADDRAFGPAAAATEHGARGTVHARNVAAMMPVVARIFVTRELPFPALDRLAAEHELDVWVGDLPPGPQALRERASRADAVLALVPDPVGSEGIAPAPRLQAIAH